tara:strand:+ start:470 stop:1114 length:645 start_codon:yes stop_codon:yes gene_type:complete
MHNSVDKLLSIEKEIYKKSSDAKIVAVSKTFPISKIIPLINHGHEHFGENKVQEAVEKWTSIKNDFPNIKLHMIGKLQTNKIKFALPLFDYIHSLDNLKLAEKISNEQKKFDKKPKIFIQINIGDEEQKSGINASYLKNFYSQCINDLDLDIIGIMCLPPNDLNPEKYFKEMKKLSKEANLKEISMGMSNDYLKAVEYNATFLRIGSSIFGPRS